MFAETIPNINIPNPKQIRNPKTDKKQAFVNSDFSSFEIRICFEFRDSDFEFAAPLAFSQRGVAKRHRAADSFGKYFPFIAK
jgi:hypothetical protein